MGIGKDLSLRIACTILMGLASGCTDSGGNSELNMCYDHCSKNYEECGDEYISMMDDLGKVITTDDLADLQSECEVECRDDVTENDVDLNCIKGRLSTECRSLVNSYETRSTVYLKCFNDCLLALDCDEFFSFGSYSNCDKECAEAAEDLTNAREDLFDACAAELMSAMEECGMGYKYGINGF